MGAVRYDPNLDDYNVSSNNNSSTNQSTQTNQDSSNNTINNVSISSQSAQDIMQDMINNSNVSISNNVADAGFANSQKELLEELRKQLNEVTGKIDVNSKTLNSYSNEIDRLKEEVVKLNNLKKDLSGIREAIEGAIDDYSNGGYLSGNMYYHEDDFKNIKNMLIDDFAKIERSYFTITKKEKN